MISKEDRATIRDSARAPGWVQARESGRLLEWSIARYTKLLGTAETFDCQGKHEAAAEVRSLFEYKMRGIQAEVDQERS